MASVLILAGKAPKPGTILADVAHLLGRAGVEVTVVVPTVDGAPEPGGRFDLVVHRGLGTSAPTVAGFGLAGQELCNPWPTVGLEGDRVAILRALATAGVGVPLGTRVTRWGEVRSLAGTGDVVVKRPLGAGRGREVTMEVGEDPPFDGPYVVESFVPNDGLDRKLYVAGDAVFGLLKPSTLLVEHGGPAVPFAVDDVLGEVALRAAEAVGLHLCGIDVLLADRGPVVVDVNPFPGFRGIPGAPAAVVEHLLTHL